MKPQTSGLLFGKLKRKVLREPVGVGLNGKIQGFGGDAVDFASSLFGLMDGRVGDPTGTNLPCATRFRVSKSNFDTRA
jgi:hypothetical protein